MGQYKHNFYGTSYYGATNAYSGLYETNYIDTEEALNGVVDFKIKAHLPKAYYTSVSEEVIIAPSWPWVKSPGTIAGKAIEYVQIDRAATSIKISATSDSFKMYYKSTPDSVTSMKLEVRTWDTEQTYTSKFHTITTKSVSALETFWELTGLTYGTHEFILTFDPAITGKFFFGGFQIGVTHLTVESRASINESGWTPYSLVSYTKTLIKDDWYYLTGKTVAYPGKNRIQFKIFMASSDNELTPLIEDILATAGDTKNRTVDGKWIANVNMNVVATKAGKSFKKILKLDWEDVIEPNTSILYKSVTATTKPALAEGPVSIPYTRSAQRLRLKEGRNYGYVTTRLLNPASRNPNLQNLFWVNWRDKAYLPEDRVETGYKYEFLDEKNVVIYSIQDPSADKYKMLEEAIKNRPFKLRIQLFKRFDKATPAVDGMIFNAKLHFTEDKVINNKDISSIDANGSGEKNVLNMSTLVYNFPPELSKTTVEYKLIDETARPTGVGQEDLYLYLESEKTLSSKVNITLNPEDKVFAKAIGKEPGSATGPLLHYQYGGGLSYYESDKSNIKKYEATSSFQPSLVGAKRYRSLIKLGWPSQYHTTSGTETLLTVGFLYGVSQEEILGLPENAYLKEDTVYNPDKTVKVNHVVKIPNKTINENIKAYWESEKDIDANARTYITEKLVHNNLPNDFVMAEVSESSARGEVDWASEEKIYSGFLNLNNAASLYQREHFLASNASDKEHEHVVQVGETYQVIADLYGVNEEDIRWKNGAREQKATDQPFIGGTVVVPPKISLPSLPPEVKIGNNPYSIEIIHNSVKLGNEILPKDIINHINLEVAYEEVSIVRQPVRRGVVANTADTLAHNKIVRINGVYNSLVESVSAPYYLKGTDYNVVDNSLDWSLSVNIGKEPIPGNTYYVSYTYQKPVGVKIRINSDYQVQIGSDRLWRSGEIKEFFGMVMPKMDFRQKLPPMEEWSDYNAKDVYDIDYLIEDNDLWTKTWIEEKDGEHYVVGSLMGKVPKDNWIPYIHTGFYYLGKEEHYLFSEPLEEELDADAIPIAKNIKYVEGKYGGAVQIEPASTNLVLNSSFEVKDNKSLIRKITF